MQITCKAFSSYLHFQNPLTPLLMILTYPGCRSSQKWKWNGSHSVLSDSLRPPWTVACQAPLSMEFSRQEYWSGLPFPSAGILPDPGIKPGFPALQTDSLPTELRGKSLSYQSSLSCQTPVWVFVWLIHGRPDAWCWEILKAKGKEGGRGWGV